jgi:hypothetical protein
MNFKNLTYQQKNKYLLLGSLVFLVVVYLAAIQNTINLYQKNSSREQALLKAEDAPQKIENYRQRLDELNNRLSYYVVDSIKGEEHILEVVSNFCHKNHILLNRLPAVTTDDHGDVLVATTGVVAEGNYKDLLNLLYELEQKQKIARVTSAVFKSQFDHKRKKKVLTLTVYLQNIQIKESSNEKV